MLRKQIHDHVEWVEALAEFERLVSAAGMEVVDSEWQIRIRSHAGLLFGRGKVQEFAQRVALDEIDVVAVYNLLTSMQKYRLQQALKCIVLDRYEVVLRVFEREARDRVSKLQLELAHLQKSFPFIKVAESERLLRERPTRGEGRGPGEYAYHSQLRQARKRIAKVSAQLQKLRKENQRRLRKRRELNIPLVCLVGCYNAGKTSLFNALTGLDKEVSERPFTTLASKWSQSENPGMLVVDTIGFALGLDPRLISAFQLNLDDMRAADILLLVVDVVDDKSLLQLKLRDTMDILKAIDIDQNRILVVLNKADVADPLFIDQVVTVLQEQYHLSSIPVSALTGYNLDELVTQIRIQFADLGPVELSTNLQ
jgi:GTP-binding protein HflX